MRAVQRLHEHGICFSVTSSRPPFGLQMLVQPLSLTLPLGAFNGAVIVGPDMQMLEHHLLSETGARRCVDWMSHCGADVWVYTADRWLILDPNGPYVEREARTIQAQPTTVRNLAPYLHRAAKIVGVSEDFALLAQCEAEVRRELVGMASVARSQAYYVDVTPPGLDKGTFVDTLPPASLSAGANRCAWRYGKRPSHVPASWNVDSHGECERCVKEPRKFRDPKQYHRGIRICRRAAYLTRFSIAADRAEPLSAANFPQNGRPKTFNIDRRCR